MKWFRKAKDGGPESTVLGYWLVEAKKGLSAVLLRFAPGTREKYHSHAFNSVNWFVWPPGGKLEEHSIGPSGVIDTRTIGPGPRPIVTRRTTFHRVVSTGTNWVISLRGPWADTWLEWDPVNRLYSRLAKGRKVLKTWRSSP